jgi:multicomponent Na+:H+ antiporter subunit E
MDPLPRSAAPAAPLRSIAVALSVRFPLLLLGWGALSEGEALWPWGTLAAAAMTLVSLRLVPPRPGRLRLAPRLAMLLPEILLESLKGGFDVARRALTPGRPLAPKLELVRLARPDRGVAVTLAYASTLMPGTLAVEVDARRLLVHVIDRKRNDCAAIQHLERRLRPRREGAP